MKNRFILFTCITISLALTTCENQQIIGLLKAPTELDYLDITAYADEFPLTGGVSLEPAFRPSVFEYTVYVSKEANRFTIDAGLNAQGKVVAYNENDQTTGTDFDYFDDEAKILTLTVQRKYMAIGKYRLTVVRGDPVPVAEDITITVTPAIGAFFINSGVLPKLEVKAQLPAAGGELSYKWYMNNVPISIGGLEINGADGLMGEIETGFSAAYTMRQNETSTVRTLYYYAEITNTLEGKTGVTVSAPCRVSFVSKNELADKSVKMVSIPATAANVTTDTIWDSKFRSPWNTPGFSMGENLVTWELWKTILDYARAGGYEVSRIGNQGAEIYKVINTNVNAYPVGNKYHPVTFISWRDAVIWCNAYSEMDGKDPVYRDEDGEPLRNSRLRVEHLIDTANMDYNGYRLPTQEEWLYAARGANPNDTTVWNYTAPGTDDKQQEYLWAYSPGSTVNGSRQTGEVGSMKPNTIGLYDMMGMVHQWLWWSTEGTGIIDLDYYPQAMSMGGDMNDPASVFTSGLCSHGAPPGEAYDWDERFTGFRVARNKD